MKAGERKKCGQKKNRHHIYPKGHKDLTEKEIKRQMQNCVVSLYEDKHKMLHFIFGNLTVDEIIEVLQRLKKMKTNKIRKNVKRIARWTFT